MRNVVSNFVALPASDIAVFFVANAANLLLAAMFLLRAQGMSAAARVSGTAVVILALPAAAAIVANALAGRNWWLAVLPLPFIVFCVVEFAFDYVLMLEFRSTGLLGPYLAIYYLGLLGLIGYTFLIDKPYGFATLVTYFVGLAATWYSFAKVGHG
ncbi:MAG: hypothetical protein ACYC1C_00830 [Chloroflexota bacterium]